MDEAAAWPMKSSEITTKEKLGGNRNLETRQEGGTTSKRRISG